MKVTEQYSHSQREGRTVNDDEYAKLQNGACDAYAVDVA